MKGILNLYLSVGPELSSIGIVTGLIQTGVVCSHCGNEFSVELNRCTICGAIIHRGVYEQRSFYAENSDMNERQKKDNGLLFNDYDYFLPEILDKNVKGKSDIERITIWLNRWLDQLGDYELQVIIDHDIFEWNGFLKLNPFYKDNGLRENLSSIPYLFNSLLVHNHKKSPKEAAKISREWLFHNTTPQWKVMTVWAIDMREERFLDELNKAKRLRSNFIKYGGEGLWDTNC